MKFEEIVIRQRKKIVKKLKRTGYANRKINYEEFLLIYDPYKNMMGEVEFASVLGLCYTQYKNMSKKGTHPTILKQSPSPQRKASIQEYLKAHGYTNKSIYYPEFLELYKKYRKEMIETDFAETIGISISSYKEMKNRGSKTKILATPIDRVAIWNEVEKEYGSIYVTYQEFLDIYKKYEPIIHDEALFAEILNVSRNSFRSMKNGGKRVLILKPDNIDADLKCEIIEYAKKQGYENRLSNYQEFLCLYKPFKERIKEVLFAKCLGINDDNHKSLKKGARICILKDLTPKKEIDYERQEEIRIELILKGYANKCIDYNIFKTIYKPYYKEMDEVEFAKIIGISYENYLTIKEKPNRRAVILKTTHISDTLINTIENDENIKSFVGNYIDLNQFNTLYQPYELFLTKIQFAEIIGISYTRYKNLGNYRVKVDRLYTQRLRANHEFKESRFYSKEEIEEFCQRYNCDIKDFIKMVFKTDKKDVINIYSDVLKTRGIYIGYKEIDSCLLGKHAPRLVYFINKKSKELGNYYKQNIHVDDIASDALLYISQKRGDVFLNFDDDYAIQLVEHIATGYIKRRYAWYLKRAFVSIDTVSPSCYDHVTWYVDKERKTEKAAIEHTNMPRDNIYEKCVNLLNNYYEYGYSIDESIHQIANELNYSSVELLEVLKEYLLLNDKIKQLPDERVYLSKAI